MTYWITAHSRVRDELLGWMSARGLKLRIGPIRSVMATNDSLVIVGLYIEGGYRTSVDSCSVEFVDPSDELRYGEDLREWLAGRTDHTVRVAPGMTRTFSYSRSPGTVLE